MLHLIVFFLWTTLIPIRSLPAQPLDVPCVYRPLTLDCHALVVDSLLDSASGWTEFNLAACSRNGVNVIFQLRPGPLAPESLRGVPFTTDLRMDALSAAGLGIVAHRADSTLSINTGFLQYADRAHSPGDSTALGTYAAHVGDTLYYDFSYRTITSTDSVFTCACGQDVLRPGIAPYDTLQPWQYGHLRRFEVLDSSRIASYLDPTRLEVASLGCAGRGTMVNPCDSFAAVLSLEVLNDSIAWIDGHLEGIFLADTTRRMQVINRGNTPLQLGIQITSSGGWRAAYFTGIDLYSLRARFSNVPLPPISTDYHTADNLRESRTIWATTTSLGTAGEMVYPVGDTHYLPVYLWLRLDAPTVLSDYSYMSNTIEMNIFGRMQLP